MKLVCKYEVSLISSGSPDTVGIDEPSDFIPNDNSQDAMSTHGTRDNESLQLQTKTSIEEYTSTCPLGRVAQYLTCLDENQLN